MELIFTAVIIQKKEFKQSSVYTRLQSAPNQITDRAVAVIGGGIQQWEGPS